MTITDIVANGKNVQIYVDNEFWGEVPYLVAFDYRVSKGEEVSEQTLQVVRDKADESACLDYCVWYLSRYSQSVKNMRIKLYQKGYSHGVVTAVIERLKSNKLLDDYAFAQNIVDSKSNRLGKRRLRQELSKKGIDSDIIDQVLCDISDDDMMTGAMSVATKWYRSHSLETFDDKQKFCRFMAYRGFDFEVINKCKEALTDGKDD